MIGSAKACYSATEACQDVPSSKVCQCELRSASECYGNIREY